MRRSKTKKLAKAKADKYFSLYIRKRDEGKPCITCGKRSNMMDCGHFISRECEATRYDEQNSNSQCAECNRFKSGKQYEHGLAIDKKYGGGTAEAILIKSKMRCQRKQFDYEYIAEEFKKKLSELQK
jgi:hypothetical protein